MSSEANASVFKTKRWRWWHVALAVVALILVASLFGGSKPKLKVSVYRQGAAGYQRVEAVNTGDKAVTITSVIVNDRPDCELTTLDQITVEKPVFKPTKLEVGEGNTWFTLCRIVRATLATSQGSATYEFK